MSKFWVKLSHVITVMKGPNLWMQIYEEKLITSIRIRVTFKFLNLAICIQFWMRARIAPVYIS